ncbi:hypothetical protein [Candidatus Thioglobus sp.]|jgi:hypothetical protein|uniref:hypothetical protein n=1 Tax=Candidatus Thioglobus sp. TaxID=2026721 RepID=UPI0017FC6E6C|nr:hypothetical protein [Candidatus Thioglobus sp.]HIF35248.1 hypothetical protein [Candidatus Thioglobus sp.]
MSHKYSQKPEKCPECGSENILNIVYGYPDDGLDKKAQEGRVILGGCCITGDDPKWQCAKCEADFYRIKKEL